MTAERTWIVDGKPVTLAEFRATVDAAKVAANAKFAADWGGLTVEQAIRTACANAHLFKPAGGRRRPRP